jgi:hypothetical protein
MLVKEVESQEKGDINIDDVHTELDEMFWAWNRNRYADHSHAFCQARSEFEKSSRRECGRLEIETGVILAAVALRLNVSDY